MVTLGVDILLALISVGSHAAYQVRLPFFLIRSL
jgi:hypothetical protein